MLRFRVDWGGSGGLPGVATHYFGGAAHSADVTNAAARITAAYAALVSVVASGMTMRLESTVDVIDPATGLLTDSDVVASTTAVGTDTGQVLPTLIQGLVTWRTSAFFLGRRLIGHTYIAGNTETHNPPGSTPGPDGPYQTAVTNFVNAMLGTPSPGLVVWRRPKLTAPTHAGTSSPVTTGAMSPIWSVLRSRRS